MNSKEKKKKLTLKNFKGTPKPKTSSQDYKINKGYKKFQSPGNNFKSSIQKKNIILNITPPLIQDDNQKKVKEWAKKKIQEELFRGKKKPSLKKTFENKRKLTIGRALTDNDGEIRQRSEASVKRARDKILKKSGDNLGISKVNTIVSQVSKRFGSKEDIVFGAVIDEALGDRIEICILAKADLEVVHKSIDSSDDVSSKIDKSNEISQPNLGEIALEPLISENNEPPRAVHKSKLTKKKLVNSKQNEFTFDTEVQRGYFDKTERNMYKEEDLDVPTFMRRGIKIRIKT